MTIPPIPLFQKDYLRKMLAENMDRRLRAMAQADAIRFEFEARRPAMLQTSPTSVHSQSKTREIA